jgi:hypothetical protein
MDDDEEKDIRMHNLTLKKSQLPLWAKVKIHKITHGLKSNNDAVVDLLEKGLEVYENRK